MRCWALRRQKSLTSAGVSYTVNVSNASLAAATSGTVTITEALPSGLILQSLYGAGWTCSTTTCTRSDALAAGELSALTVAATIATGAPLQMTNVVTISGGGTLAGSSQIVTSLGSAGSPEPVIAWPAGGSGSSQTFTFTLTDPNGWQNMTVVDILVNRYLNAVHACYIAIVPSSSNSGTALLVDDAGDAGGPFAAVSLPGSGTAQNSQCVVSGTGSSISGSGDTLQFTLNMSFPTSFSGARTMYALRKTGLATPDGKRRDVVRTGSCRLYRTRGQRNESATKQYHVWSDVYIHFYRHERMAGPWRSRRSGEYCAERGPCMLLRVCRERTDQRRVIPCRRRRRRRWSFLTLALPGSGTAQNSQCSISGAGGYASAIGTTLNLTVPVTFSETFGGNRLVYMAAGNKSGGNTGWITGGSVNVP